MKIAVLGAGISGTTTAYALTDKGHEVTLIDRERYAGMDTSLPTAVSCPPVTQNLASSEHYPERHEVAV